MSKIKRVYGQSNMNTSKPNYKKAINSVFTTSDYNMFQFSKFNRNVLLRKEMIEQAKEGFIAPIIVNENFLVIDGQHRLVASEKIGVPVSYIIIPGLNEDDIVRMNSVQKPWSLRNYIEAYANEGIEEYVRLVELIKKNYANVSVVINISVDSPTKANNIQNLVKNGKFKFFDYNKTVEFLKYYERFKLETDTVSRSGITTSLYSLFRIKGFDRDRMIKKIRELNIREELVLKSSSHTATLKTMIDAYNNRLSPNSKKFIDYHINSQGNLILHGELHSWTKEKK